MFKYSAEIFEDLTNEQIDVVRAGLDQIKALIKSFKLGQLNRVFQSLKLSNDGLFRLLEMTYYLMSYSGDSKHEYKLKSFIKQWEDLGYQKIVEALEVRLAEARTPLEIIEELSDSYLIPYKEDEEQAPDTKRSLVAKILQYTNIFYKVARG